MFALIIGARNWKHSHISSSAYSAVTARVLYRADYKTNLSVQ